MEKEDESKLKKSQKTTERYEQLAKTIDEVGNMTQSAGEVLGKTANKKETICFLKDVKRAARACTSPKLFVKVLTYPSKFFFCPSARPKLICF